MLRKKILSLSAGIVALGLSTSFAGYDINCTSLITDTMVQGRDYACLLTSNPQLYDIVDLQATGPLADYLITVGANVQTGPTEYKVDTNGQLAFLFRPHDAPGVLPLTVTNTNDPGVFFTLNITIQKHPTTFTINPAIPTFNAGVPQNILITARDNGGSVVTAFEDGVRITDRQLGDVTSVAGAAFSGGSANTNVTVRAGNMNNKTALTVTLDGIQYRTPNTQPPASFTTGDLNLIPAAFNKLVMLFPGENLDPGFGKNGTPDTQVALVPVGQVTIWRVDSFFNPILTSVPTVVSFDSSDPTDTPPGNRNMNVPPLLILGGANDPFIFATNGTRTVSATPDGNANQADTSIVNVSPGANQLYNILLQPPAVVTTDDVVTIEVEATDTLGNRLTNLFGPLPNAELRARVVGTPTEEHIEWVDTNPATVVHENVVNFQAGLATVNLNVTKRGNLVDLHYVDETGAGVFSNQFQVNVGALDRIHLTIRGLPGVLVGETHAPGYESGNSGVPPIVTAGDELVVEARTTDRRYNIVSGPAVNGRPINLDHFLPNSYISWDHPDAPTVTFDITGILEFQNPPFDRSFRVTMRSAGATQRFIATTDFSGSDFLSSQIEVIPDSYAKVAIRAPGETLVPGSFLSDGKSGSPTPQAADIQFPVTVYLTDQFWNPIVNGPFRDVSFDITPSNPGSFINGVNLGSPVNMPGGSKVFQVTLAEDSDIRVQDHNSQSINQTVSVLVGAGVLDHFDFTFTVPGTKEAGVPYNVTIEAKDIYNNTITNYNNNINLLATTGGTTMSPETVALTNGVFTGDLTNFAAGTGITIRMSQASVFTDSPAFDVTVNSLGFQKVLLLGPDQSHFPGSATGKTGSNANRQVGTGFPMTAIACDNYWNKLTNVSGDPIDFSTDRFGVFSPSNGNFATGEFTTTFVMHEATLHTVTANAPIQGFSDTTPTNGTPGNYSRVQILAPGEVPQPGNAGNGGKDPAFPPTDQVMSVRFPVEIRAVDDFYNLDTSYNGGDTLLSINTANAIFIPANNVLNGPTPNPFVNGTITREALIGEESIQGWTLDARDQNNLTFPGQNVNIVVNPGPVYVFTTPATATAGQPMNVTIQLQNNGVNVNGYNESIFLKAYFPAGGEATGQFNPDGTPREYVMNDGEIVINDLIYSYVEDIQIQVTDNFGRVAFSNTIVVNPSGFKYVVTTPASSPVGPPDTFPVTVELRDIGTDTLITNSAYDHTMDIGVTSLVNPPTAGTWSPAEAPLTQGQATLQVSYSKAEQIQLEFTDRDNVVNGIRHFSNAILMTPGDYAKLVIVAPGETHAPGLYQHPTGKSGTPIPVDKNVAEIYQVRGVDQYWNTVDDFSGGMIFYEASDGSTNANDPVNQNTPLVNGAHAAAITLRTAGSISLLVRDNGNPSIIPQSVLVPVSGTFFDFPSLPNQTNTCAFFTMQIILKDSSGATLPVNGPITITPVLPDLSPANGKLDVTTVNLVAGVATINNQSYTVAEDVRFLVEGFDTANYTSAVSFVPRSIYYVYEDLPLKTEVNEPFPFVIQAMDADCGTKVVNMNRPNLPIEAFSAITNLPVPGFTPIAINIVQGKSDVNAVHTTAEKIYLILQDSTDPIFDPPPAPTQEFYTSPTTIDVTPGRVASLEIDGFSVQANKTIDRIIIARDAFNNLIPNRAIKLSINNLVEIQGGLVMNGKLNEFIGKTDSNGELAVTFAPTPDGHGPFQVLITDHDIENGFDKIVTANVQGFPRVPATALDRLGNRIPVNSTFDLNMDNLSLAANGGTIRTFYRVDGLAWTPYDPAKGIQPIDSVRGYDVFTEAREYIIEWYSEICYDPQCTDPVSELTINGAANIQAITTYVVDGKLAGYPSPFNPKSPSGNNFMTLQYPLPVISSVEIDIYDLFGQKVYHRDISAGAEGGLAKQDNRIFWDGKNDDGVTVANGGYIVRVKIGATGNTIKTKVLVVK